MNAQFAGPGRAPARRHLRMRSFVDRLLRLPNPFWIIIMFARSASFAQTSFYSVVDTDLTPYANGALIRSEPIEGAPDGAAAYRVLYKSEGLHGEDIAVSGVVIVPAGPAPAGGRPIVAWAHPTTGIVPKSAPSLARVLFQSI